MPKQAPAELEWEERELALPRGTTREGLRRLLTELADHERWELARSRVYPNGDRKVWLRRRVYKVSRAPADAQGRHHGHPH